MSVTEVFERHHGGNTLMENTDDGIHVSVSRQRSGRALA
jgi:hypothetical protein